MPVEDVLDPSLLWEFHISIRFALRLILRVVPEVGVGVLLESRVTSSAELSPSPCSGGVRRSTSPAF